jgi:hypothetical protein
VFAAALLHQVMADQQGQNLSNRDARTEDISLKKIWKKLFISPYLPFITYDIHLQRAACLWLLSLLRWDTICYLSFVSSCTLVIWHWQNVASWWAGPSMHGHSVMIYKDLESIDVVVFVCRTLVTWSCQFRYCAWDLDYVVLISNYCQLWNSVFFFS